MTRTRPRPSRPSRWCDMAEESRDGVAGFLRDLRDFAELVANILSDDTAAQDMFGFSVDVGFITHVDLIQEMFAEVALGRPDLVDIAELGARLAEITEAGELLKQAAESS